MTGNLSGCIQQCFPTSVPRQNFRCSSEFYKNCIFALKLKKGNIMSFEILRILRILIGIYIYIPLIFLFGLSYVLFSYTGTLIGQEFISRYKLWIICSILPPFHEAKFCGVPSSIFDKLRCTAGENILRITCVCTEIRQKYLSWYHHLITPSLNSRAAVIRRFPQDKWSLRGLWDYRGFIPKTFNKTIKD